MERSRVEELLYQALETELGGVKVYETAVRCARNDDLKEEWREYLEQTKRRAEEVREVCQAFGLDPERETPGRQIVRHKGQALVQAMERALQAGDPAAAELVACECVVDAETKDHQNWELMSSVADKLMGAEKQAREDACEEMEEGGGRAPLPHDGLVP